jgi:hypothetical protein
MEEQRFETTTPLMRPRQVEAEQEEIDNISRTLTAPPHIRAQIEDIGEYHRRAKALRKSLDVQSPRAYEGLEVDRAKAREKQLRESMRESMPTAAEMRKNPPGAVGKHMAWEKNHKANLLEWQNIRLRLLASGALDNDHDVANFEAYRPVGGSQELSMDNAQIPGKQFHFPPGGVGDTVVLSSDDLDFLRAHELEIFQKVAFMTADQRAQVKELVEVLRRAAGLEASAPTDTADSDVTVHAPAKPAAKARKPVRRESEWNKLQKRAKALNIPSFGKTRDVLAAEVAAAEAEIAAVETKE